VVLWHGGLLIPGVVAPMCECHPQWQATVVVKVRSDGGVGRLPSWWFLLDQVTVLVLVVLSLSLV